MNNVRKQIIEIIEPYMDKTLSEGCIVILKQGYVNGYTIIGNSVIGLDGTNQSFYGFCGTKQGGFLENDIDKIIGHYDITAVLKYIEEGSYYALLKIFITRDLKEIILEEGEDTQEEVYFEPQPHFIPNKPLHLFSEQEEKELLELLQKIGKQK